MKVMTRNSISISAFILLCSAFQGVKLTEITGDENACHQNPLPVHMEDILPGIASGDMVVVDVRRKEELIETGKIPGSFNIPLNEMEQAFLSLNTSEFSSAYGFDKPLGSQLVITCRSGRRAQVAWNSLKDHGYCHARVYFGSFLEWSANSQPIEPVEE